MFIINASDPLPSPVPPPLIGLGVQLHDFLQLSNADTIWILQVGNARETGAAHRVRRYELCSLIHALYAAAQTVWRNRVLYALGCHDRPGAEETTLSKVVTIWECLEPNGVVVCHEVITEHGAMLVSKLGTALGAQTRVREIWNEAGFQDLVSDEGVRTEADVWIPTGLSRSSASHPSIAAHHPRPR